MRFRYVSEWGDFETAVKVLKTCLEKGTMHFCIGFIEDFTLIADDEIESDAIVDDKSIQIIKDEILYLITSGLEELKMDEESVYHNLLSAKVVPEEQIKKVTKEVCNKYELVSDTFDIEQLKLRYDLKNNSVNKKVSSLDYNIIMQEQNNREYSSFALISLGVKKNLIDSDSNKLKSLSVRNEIEDSTTFICDENDIEIMISELKIIQKKIRESNHAIKNGKRAE